jgi:hypothetical protein
MISTRQHRPEAVKERGERAERNERIHVGCQTARVAQHADVELPPENENDDRAQKRLNPDADIVAEQHPGQLDIEHRQHYDGSRKQQGKGRSPFRRTEVLPRLLLVIPRKLRLEHPITIFDDHIVERAYRHNGVVIFDAGAVRGQIDRRIENALELLEGPFIAYRTRGTLHSSDIECGRCHDFALYFKAPQTCSGSGSR